MDLKFGRVVSCNARVPGPPPKESGTPEGRAAELLHFHGRKNPGRLEKVAQGVRDLGHPDESRRMRAVRELAMICCQEHGNPNEIYPRLVVVFRHNAMNSPFDDVRKGSLDALYLCHELSLLREIPSDGAKPEFVHHLDWLVRKLEERQNHPH